MRAFLKSIDRRGLAGLPSVTIMHAAMINPSKPLRRRLALIATFAAMLAAVLTLAALANPQHPGMPRGQKHESRHEIDQLEKAWRSALLKGNTAAMDALLADDYMAITDSGILQTKEQTLANLRSGNVRLTALDISDRKVRFYGTTALVTSLAEVQGTTPEGNISGSYRFTHVYARNAQGTWKIVSFEASKIREPGEHK
jgi:ketosteroid isomerase-like protein